MRWLGRAGLVVLLASPSACQGPRGPAAAGDPVVPAPPPSASPSPRGCGLPPGGGSGRGCPVELPQFGIPVNVAIHKLQNEHPELFDFNEWLGGLSYKVLDRQRFHAGVVENLEGMGYCAFFDGEEVGVKNTNAFNEQYQVMTSFGFSRWGAGAYRSTCYPAWF
jgi:hypothetical protein